MIYSHQTRIMAFGTFDALHPGHLDFFKQARKLSPNPFLIISVARDVNVKTIKKHNPQFSELKRLRMIASCPLVDKVVLGGIKNYLPHILKENPHIIALGYDQTAYVKNLKFNLKCKGLSVRLVRLKAFKPNIFKSSIVKRQKRNVV